MIKIRSLRNWLAIGCAVTVLAGGLTMIPKSSAAAADTVSNGWELVKPDSSNPWDIGSNGNILNTTRSVNYDSNFLVRESEEAYGDYTVSAHFELSANTVTTSGTTSQIGLVPWYLDENNYITATIWWRNENWSGSRDDTIINLLIYGKQDGQNLQVYDGNVFARKEFTDFWVYNNGSYFSGEDQEILERPINVEGGWDFTVEKYHAGNTTIGLEGDVMRLVLNDIEIGTCIVNMTVPYRERATRVGVVSGNVSSALTVTDFTVEDGIRQELAGTDNEYGLCEYNFNSVKGAPAGTVATGKKGGSWSYNSETQEYTGDATEPVRSDTLYQLVRPLTGVQGVNYTVATTAYIVSDSESASEVAAGLIAWYLDYNNYIYADILQSNGKWYARFSGVIGGYDVSSEFSEELTDITDASRISIDKEYNALTFSVDGKDVLNYRDAALYTQVGYVGFHVFGCVAKFSELEINEIAFEPFGEYIRSFNGAEYYVSSETQDDFIFADGKFTVDARNFEKPAYAVTSPDITEGSLTTTVTLAESVVFGERGSFGVMAYYENRDNYVFAVITRNSGRDIKAQIYRMDENGLEKIHEEKVSGIILTDLLTLKTTIKNGEISFYAEGKALVEACYVSSITLSERMMSGIVAWGTEMTVYPPVFDGFKVHKLFQLTEKYSVRGASYGTWKANEDGTVEGSAIAGDRTDFYGKNLADIDICIQDVTSVYSDDYYVYSKITVSKYDAANEFRRVGMMAWYIDDNNFLYILYSHVGANVPDVGAIGRVGGNTVANDFTNIGGLASLLNTPVEMDVHIVGNSIEIYGGKSPLPIFKYNVPGMAAASRNAIASGKKIMSGYFVHALNATFSDFNAGAELTAVNTVKPEITFLSNKPTSVKLNETVTIPIVDVIDITGEPVNAEFTVIDPHGNAVTLISNSRFVAEIEGKYTITVNAVNSWGTAAEPISWQVEVEAEKIESNAVAIAVYTVLGVSGLLFCAAFVLFIIKKKPFQKITREKESEGELSKTGATENNGSEKKE